jgi:hypothetical protein
MDTEKDSDKDTDKDTDKHMDMDTHMELDSFARYPYGALVLTALSGLPVIHDGASSNGAINL